MDIIFSLVDEYSLYIFAGLLLFCVALLVMCISLFSRVRKIDEKRGMVLPADSVGCIMDVQNKHSQTLKDIAEKISQLASMQSEFASKLENCIQHIGLVRFNAFDDVGGEQSFALSLLDDHKNGVIISNIYGRQDTRVYAKNISCGKSERTLSDEESKAVEIAMNSDSQVVHQ